MAARAWSMLATGMGGIDWQGLPIVATLLGVPDEDLERLVLDLMVIKHHRPPKTGA